MCLQTLCLVSNHCGSVVLKTCGAVILILDLKDGLRYRQPWADSLWGGVLRTGFCTCCIYTCILFCFVVLFCLPLLVSLSYFTEVQTWFQSTNHHTWFPSSNHHTCSRSPINHSPLNTPLFCEQQEGLLG